MQIYLLMDQICGIGIGDITNLSFIRVSRHFGTYKNFVRSAESLKQQRSRLVIILNFGLFSAKSCIESVRPSHLNSLADDLSPYIFFPGFANYRYMTY